VGSLLLVGAYWRFMLPDTLKRSLVKRVARRFKSA
jgi:hypothetical protein